FATVAELAGAKLPEGVTLDSHSFAPQIKGQKGTPREWVYVELNGKSYARDERYKLARRGAMFDLKDAPFTEAPIPNDASDPAADAARKKLRAVLDEHPAAPANPNAKKANKPAAPRKRAAAAKA